MSLFLKVVRAFFFAFTISLTTLLAMAKRVEPPDTGTPSGNTTPGATRPEANCPKTSKPLTAIFANQGQDFTVEEYPTFLFYIPYNAQQIALIEFLLLDETQTKTIYHTSIKLSNQPGIIKIQLTLDTDNSLAVNTDYTWRLNLDCKPDNTIAPDLVLQGWIRRIPLNNQINNELKLAESQAYLVYQNHSIWYDAIASLAELHFANSEDSQLTNDWNNTLKSLGLDWIIAEPLVNSELELVNN